MPYEIIATLGPSSSRAAIWSAMLSAGVTAFRLNTSHLTVEQLHQWIEKLQVFLSSTDPRCPLVLDLQGSKWRLGQFTPFELIPGQSVELVCSASAEQPSVLPVPHADFFQAASLSSGEIVLNDARVKLVMETASQDRLRARVTLGGTISPNKGITFTASTYRKESLSEKDQAILEQTRHLGFIRYALSYVKDAAEMARYRALLGDTAYLVAKLERQPALDEDAQIAGLADELWLCRGDLGAELGMAGMAEAVARFSERIDGLRVPVLMAGQVLEHMTEHPSPTRSEVCYLHDTLARGYRGFVLSDEAAIGRYPVESCQAAALFKR